MLNYRAFTRTFDKTASRLTSHVEICSKFTADGVPDTFSVEALALWDTGAVVTCIKPKLKDKLNLQTFHIQASFTGVGGKVNPDAAIIDINLLCDAVIHDCLVYIIDFPGDADVLIGMDTINMGDFVVCNTDGKTSFSFVLPSLPERTDFADIVEAINN
jgi:predicted aspartyl protease